MSFAFIELLAMPKDAFQESSKLPKEVFKESPKNVNKIPGEETGRVDPQGEQVGGGGHPGPPRPHGRHARCNKKSENFQQKNVIFPSGFTLAPMGQLGHPMMHHPMSHI